DAPFSVQVAGLRNECTHLVGAGGMRREQDWRVEDRFTRRDPVLFRHQLGPVPAIVPKHDRFLLSEPVLIASRFSIWVVLGIGLVNRPHWNSVVVVGGNIPGAAT